MVTTIEQKLLDARCLIDEALSQLSAPVPDNPVESPPTYLALPSEFSPAKYLIDPMLRHDGEGWVSDVDIASLRPVRARTYHVDPVNGSDSNSGTSTAPLRSVKAALMKPGDNEIICAPGVYPLVYGPAGHNPGKGVSIVCEGGLAVFGNDALPRQWTEHASYPGLFTAPCAVSGESWSEKGADLRFYLNHDPYNFESLGDSLPTRTVDQLKAGSVGVAVGTTSTAVRLPGNASPSYVDGFCVKWLRDNVVLGVPSGQIAYIENIVCTHGAVESARFGSAGSGTFINVNCKFIAGMSGNSAGWIGGCKIINWNCEANLGAKDGFNYHAHSSYSGPSSVLEYGCKGKLNGNTSGGANNGSTIHEHFRIVRANCDYRNNQNRNVHDIGTGASLNIGCTSVESQTPLTASFAFGHPTKGDNTRGYMLDCVTDIIHVYPGSSIWIGNCLYDTLHSEGGVHPY